MKRKHEKKRRRRYALSPIKILTADERQILFDYLSGKRPGINGKIVNFECVLNKRNLLICQVLLCTGIRAQELCNLRLQDTPIGLQTNKIFVHRGKNDADRLIPISKRLSEEIAEYIRKIRPKMMPRHVRRGDLSKPLFYSHLRKQYTADGLYRLIKRIAARAGIEKRITPHMYRHTFATESLRNRAVDVRQL